MRKKLLSLMLALLFLLTACSVGGGNGPLTEDAPPRFMAEEDQLACFREGWPEGFWARNDRGNGSPFNCSFQRDNAIVANELLTLQLTRTGEGFAGAEFRSVSRYSYGFYAVSMKAAKCSGVISSFFTYCGWPWDEIDIEFLGDDTTKVQFNYYTGGKGGHEYLYDLGFDASEGFHEYAFDWQPDSITWYVDGKAVYRATENIPSTAGNIMMNLWNVADSHGDWAGKFTPEALPVTAQYQWIGYQSAESGASDIQN